MPMHVCHLVAQELVVNFSRLHHSGNRLGHLVHFVYESVSLRIRQLIQFRHMLPGRDHAIALVILPGPQERYRLLELPDHLVCELHLGILDLLAQYASCLHDYSPHIPHDDTTHNHKPTKARISKLTTLNALC